MRTKRIVLGVIACATLSAAQSVPQPARWRVEPRHDMTIGLDDDDPAAVLQDVVSATRLPDGGILVGDHGDYALKRFSRAGRLTNRFARSGSGPGEVRYLGSMHRCGDSIYTYDIAEGHRMSVFTLNGEYVRTFRFRPPTGQQVAYVSACNAAGLFVHLGWDADREMRAGTHRAQVPVWLSAADSSTPILIDSVAESERWGIVCDRKLVGTRPLPLGKQPVVGIGRTRVYAGSADHFEVRSYDVMGRPQPGLEHVGPLVTVAKADVREEVERAVANEGETRRARVEREYAEIAMPRTLPAYTQLRVDADDHVWVRAYPLAGSDLVSWSVFSPAGQLVSVVAVSKHLEVFEVGRDYLLGRYLDPRETIPQVRLYRLTRDTSGAEVRTPPTPRPPTARHHLRAPPPAEAPRR